MIDAMGDFDAIEDPKAKVLAITELLAKIPEKNKHLKQQRQAAMLELLARPGASYRKVGAELDMSFSKVQDIAKGYSGSGTKRPKTTKEKPDDAGQDAGPDSPPGGGE